MELTAWQRFCNRILGGVLKKRARKDTELSENLVKGSMGMMPEVYLATVIFTSFAIADTVNVNNKTKEETKERIKNLCINLFPLLIF